MVPIPRKAVGAGPEGKSLMNEPLRITPGLLWSFGSAVLLAVGSLGPWATIGPFSVSGTNGDGVITLVFALIAGVLLALRRVPLAVALLGLLALLVGIYDSTNISNSGNELFSASIGWGLVLVDVAALSLAAAGVSGKKKARHG